MGNAAEQGVRPEVELLFRHRDHFAAYHNHKEQMGYAAATLYLVAATGVVLHGRDAQAAAASPALFAVLLSLAVVLGFLFVSWQLRHRTLAARVVEACTNLITQAYEEPTRQYDLRAASYCDLALPGFLVAELRRLEGAAIRLGSPQVAAWLTYVAMGAWTLFSVCALCKG